MGERSYTDSTIVKCLPMTMASGGSGPTSSVNMLLLHHDDDGVVKRYIDEDIVLTLMLM
jgi:hypothetical protein